MTVTLVIDKTGALSFKKVPLEEFDNLRFASITYKLRIQTVNKAVTEIILKQERNYALRENNHLQE